MGLRKSANVSKIITWRKGDKLGQYLSDHLGANIVLHQGATNTFGTGDSILSKNKGKIKEGKRIWHKVKRFKPKNKKVKGGFMRPVSKFTILIVLVIQLLFILYLYFKTPEVIHIRGTTVPDKILRNNGVNFNFLIGKKAKFISHGFLTGSEFLATLHTKENIHCALFYNAGSFWIKLKASDVIYKLSDEDTATLQKYYKDKIVPVKEKYKWLYE